MRKHNVVRPAIYHENRFRSLSHKARHILLTLLTCPETNLTPVLLISIGQLRNYTGLTAREVKATLVELVSSDTIFWDPDVDMIYLINYLKYNPLNSPKIEKGYQHLVCALPEHEFKQMALSDLYEPNADRVYHRVSIPLKEKEKEKDIDRSKNKNIIKSTESAQKVLDYFNLKCGTKRKRLADIEARLANGGTVEGMLKVIDFKFNEWSGDPEMRKYINPTTLFRKSNYYRYLDEAEGGEVSPNGPVNYL